MSTLFQYKLSSAHGGMDIRERKTNPYFMYPRSSALWDSHNQNQNNLKGERLLTCGTESNPGCSSRDWNPGRIGERTRTNTKKIFIILRVKLAIKIVTISQVFLSSCRTRITPPPPTQPAENFNPDNKQSHTDYTSFWGLHLVSNPSIKVSCAHSQGEEE